MINENFGGNIVTEVGEEPQGLYELANFSEFSFMHTRLRSPLSFRIDKLKSWFIAVIHANQGSQITLTCEKGDFPLKKYALGENMSFSVNSTGPAVLLIGGTSAPSSSVKRLSLREENEVKQVSKPWGHELWVTETNPVYSFKEILIRKGHQTSLQYHVEKKEVTFVSDGKIKLHYKTGDLPNDLVGSKDVSQVELGSGTSVAVKNGVLHRIEALSDTTIYEISTPQLDDVVRVMDVTRRPNGRIESEHAAR